MDLSPEALAYVERHPHGERYRQLLDASHPDYNPAYFAVVEAKARGEKPKPTPPPILDPEEEKRRRRARKPRVPLGVKSSPGRR